MILVTGGCGFIGLNLVRKLSEHFDVLVLDNLSTSYREEFPSRVTFIEGDIRNYELVSNLMEKVHTCFHLAALTDVNYCEEDPLYCTQVNFVGSQVLFEAARNAKNKIRVIYASSAAVYGDNIGESNNKESDVPHPKSFYGYSKYQTEILAQHYSKNHSLQTVGLRFFNVYGYPFNKKSSYAGVIKKFIEASTLNEPLIVYGDGTQTRDFIYVGDIVKVCISLLQKENVSGVFNVGTGKATSINELIDIFSHKKKLKVEYQLHRKADISRSVANIENLKAALPDFSPLPLPQGLDLMGLI